VAALGHDLTEAAAVELAAQILIRRKLTGQSLIQTRLPARVIPLSKAQRTAPLALRNHLRLPFLTGQPNVISHAEIPLLTHHGPPNPPLGVAQRLVN